MTLTIVQIQLRDVIALAAEKTGCKEITYCTEYLGYLPFGQYHWIQCAGVDIAGLPHEFIFGDLLTLEQSGFLERLGQWQNPTDELDQKVFYRIRSDGMIRAV